MSVQNNFNFIDPQSNPLKTNVLYVIKDDESRLFEHLEQSPIVDLPSIVDPRLPSSAHGGPTLATLDSEVVDITRQVAEESQGKKLWEGTGKVLSILDTGMDLVNASAKIAGQQDLSDIVDKVQIVNKVAIGAQAAEEGRFSLDPQKLANGSYEEQVSLGKSGAFVATCLSATVQAGSAIVSAVGGESLSTVASACNDYIVPIINRGIKGPALLLSYYAGYHKNADAPQDTEEEKNQKQIQRGNNMLKAGITTTKLASCALSYAAPALGVSAVVATPLAVAVIGAACVDGYLAYKTHLTQKIINREDK